MSNYNVFGKYTHLTFFFFAHSDFPRSIVAVVPAVLNTPSDVTFEGHMQMATRQYWPNIFLAFSLCIYLCWDFRLRLYCSNDTFNCLLSF